MCFWFLSVNISLWCCQTLRLTILACQQKHWWTYFDWVRLPSRIVLLPLQPVLQMLAQSILWSNPKAFCTIIHVTNKWIPGSSCVQTEPWDLYCCVCSLNRANFGFKRKKLIWFVFEKCALMFHLEDMLEGHEAWHTLSVLRIMFWNLPWFSWMLTSCSVLIPLQVHPLQRKALQMSGVWEGLLSVQDSGRPQNITHAGQGTEAGQDQVIHSASREGTGTLEKHDQRQSKNNQRLFISEPSAAMGILLKDEMFHQPDPKEKTQP